MPTPLETTWHNNLTKLLVLLPLRANSKRTFQCQTPCILKNQNNIPKLQEYFVTKILYFKKWGQTKTDHCLSSKKLNTQRHSRTERITDQWSQGQQNNNQRVLRTSQNPPKISSLEVISRVFPSNCHQIHITSVSGCWMRFVLKICQTVGGISI